MYFLISNFIVEAKKVSLFFIINDWIERLRKVLRVKIYKVIKNIMNDKEILENFKEDYNYLENYNEIDV